MRTMPISEFRRLGVKQLQSLLIGRPIELTADGQVVGIIGAPDEIIILSDLHPFMQKKLKNTEKLARSGMPEPTLIHKAEDIGVE